MIGLVGGSEAYDPHARFGELLAEFAHAHQGSGLRLRAENRYPTELRLAGMWLAGTGARVELAMPTKPGSVKAPVLLTNPPFGKQSEFSGLGHAVDSLAENGRAVVLMPYSAGFDAGVRASAVRRDLVEQGSVVAVVGLPARLFPRTSIGVCIWLLRPPSGQATPVRFVDATRVGRPPDASGGGVHILDPADIEMIVQAVSSTTEQPGFSTSASPDTIRRNGYSLHPPEYQDRTPAYESSHAAQAELKVLFAGIEGPAYASGWDEGWPRRPLRELCEIRSGVPHSLLRTAISRAEGAADAVPVVAAPPSRRLHRGRRRGLRGRRVT